MTVKYFCDHCGKEITGKIYDVYIISHRYIQPLFPTINSPRDAIICENCKNNAFQGKYKR